MTEEIKERILKVKDVAKDTGLSRPEIYRRVKLKEFPQPIKIGARAIGWVESEVQKYIKGMIAKSRKATLSKVATDG